MDEFPEDLRQLYFEFGRAAEMAQLMELEAGNFALSCASLAFDPKSITLEERQIFQSVIDDVNRRTFGNLLKQIRKVSSVSEEIERTINDALEKRNYLFHRFFPHHNKDGRKKMREELNDIYQTFSLAHTTLLGMTQTFSEIFGVPTVSKEEALKLQSEGKQLKI